MRPMPASSQPSTIKARAFARVATTSALSSVVIAALLWASPSRALPFTSTPTWTFTSPTPATGDIFGISVVLNGNTALIGALGDNNNASSAYLFDISSGARLRTFLSPNPGAGDEFGISVALSGNTALIGADGFNSNAGAAYLYDVSNGNLLQSFFSPTPAAGDYFGQRVALGGSSALIGAARDNSNPGSAYLFDVATGNLLQSFTNPTGIAGDFFGFSVALSDSTALIGADGDGRYTGAAYVYASTSNQSVPGPLPLLGLGAAFAWSRRLRSKYRNAAQAGARHH